MNQPTVVTREAWTEARKELLAKEKAFSKAREALTAARQALPWVRVEEDYVFQGPGGDVRLSELFGQHSQLLVYHFMFAPDWPSGCKICSMCADHYNPLVQHLAQRDVSMVTISRAPVHALETFKKRMGWSFPWFSSLKTTFNQDFHVSFADEDVRAGQVYYNYKQGRATMGEEAPGISAFAKGEDDAVYHTYSAYARGLENILGIYNLLDLVPNGRDEAGLPFSMAWVKHHDLYA